MLNSYTGVKVAISEEAGVGPFVVVPKRDVERVHEAFVENGIGHTVDGYLEDDPDQRLIHIGRIWDRQWIQDVLDHIQ